MEESADRGDDGAKTTDGRDGRRRLVSGIGNRRTVLLAALGLVACGLARLVAAVRAIAGTLVARAALVAGIGILEALNGQLELAIGRLIWVSEAFSSPKTSSA